MQKKFVYFSVITYFFFIHSIFKIPHIRKYRFTLHSIIILFPYQIFIIISNNLSIPQQKTIVLNLNNF